MNARTRPIVGIVAAPLTAALAVLALAAGTAFAAPVHVDRSFGKAGLAAPSPGPAFGWLWFEDPAQEADGRVVATLNPGVNGGSALTHRYLPDGNEDPSFPPQPAPDRSKVEATLADESTVTAVNAYAEGRLELHLPGGELDSSFGTGGLSDPVPVAIRRILPLSSGEILVAGTTPDLLGHGTTVRGEVLAGLIGADGHLVAGFGSGGVVRFRTDLGIKDNQLLTMVELSGGNPLVAINSASSNELGSEASLVALNGSGELDLGFGTAGVARPGFGIGFVRALTGGSIEAVGTRWDGAHGCCSSFELLRLTAAGQPDPTFGGGDGAATAEFGGRDLAEAVLWEADGSVAIAGTTTATRANCGVFLTCWQMPAIARFDPNGQPDGSFGDDGLVTIESLRVGMRWLPSSRVHGLGRGTDGGLVLAGEAGPRAFLALLDRSGRQRSSFAAGGILTRTRPMTAATAVAAVATDRRGRILVAGSTNAGRASSLGTEAVVRYRRNGAIDRRYGRGGVAFVGGGADPEPKIAVDGANRALVADGSTVSRLTASGRPDRSFATRGVARLGANLELSSIVALRSGKVLLAGEIGRGSRARPVVVRLRSNGRLDRSFGGNGIATAGCGRGRTCAIASIAVQHDGRILIAGNVTPRRGTKRRTAVAVGRLLWSGRRDPSFGRHGWAFARPGRRSEAHDVVPQGGRILVAGQAGSGRRTKTILARFRANGRLDRRFARSGISRRIVKPIRPADPIRPRATVLRTRRHIFVIRAGDSTPLLAYGPNGASQRFRDERRLVPRLATASHVLPSPSGALQRGNPVIAWNQVTSSGLGGVTTRVALRRLSAR